MALDIFLAHTGQRLQADPSSFANLEAFKAWVSKNGKIAPQDQITLTSQGNPVKFQGLSTQNEIFVYDRRITQPSSPKSSRALQPDAPLPTKYSPSKPPDTITDTTDLQAWTDLFMARRSWALEVVDQCLAMSDQAEQRYIEMEIIVRGAQAAVDNLGKHLKTIDVKNKEVQKETADVRAEHEAAGGNWDQCTTRLRSIPASSEVIKFVTGRSPRKTQRKPALEDFVDSDHLQAAGKLLPDILQHLDRGSAALGRKVDEIFNKADLLAEKVTDEFPGKLQAATALKPMELMQDIEAIAKKVSSDYENILGFARSPKNVSQASKTALLHTKTFLPNLNKRSLEMDGILRSVTEARNAIAKDSIAVMHRLSALTSEVGETNAGFTSLELGEDAHQAIQLMAYVNELPITYASFLAVPPFGFLPPITGAIPIII